MTNSDPNRPPNLRRDSQRHAGPLIGLALVVLFGVGLVFYWLAEESASSPENATDVNVEAPVSTEGAGGNEAADRSVNPAPDAGPGSEAPATGAETVPGDNATGTEPEGGAGLQPGTPVAPTPPAPAD